MKTHGERCEERRRQNPAGRSLVEEKLASLRIGARVARLRQAVGLTQAQLASLCGMQAPNISRIENDPGHNLTVSTLVKVCRALGRSVRIQLPAESPARARRLEERPAAGGKRR